MNPDSPIGVFDSGVGGLSVLKRINEAMPAESILYFGDTAHVPYGGRPLDEVRGFALEICRFLIERGAKMIVMACNISSAVAIDQARINYPHIPILGVIEPGATSAIASGSADIGVLATLGTVSSGAYSRTITRLAPGARVTEIPCPKFVPIVEAEEVDTPYAHQASMEYLAPLANASCQAIILGCTHYPFLLSTLSTAAKALFVNQSQPSFIDPANETAGFAKATLAKQGISCHTSQEGRNRYFVSGDPQHFQQNGSFFLDQPIDSVQQITFDLASIRS